MKNNKKHKNFDKELNILDFYDKFDENLISFIKGHLFIENAMNILLKQLSIKTGNKTFHNKIILLHKNKKINDQIKSLLEKINNVRNKIAHNLYYQLTFDEMFELVKLSDEAEVIYSDDTIYENKTLSKEWYGVTGIINELFPNTFSHLFEINEDLFEEGEIYSYIC